VAKPISRTVFFGLLPEPARFLRKRAVFVAQLVEISFLILDPVSSAIPGRHGMTAVF
jgi:hypothetical protein